MLLQEVDAVLLTSLDEIAWMLNVRGNDIEYNPLVMSYLLVTQDYVKWFAKKLSSGCELDPDTEDSYAELMADGVEIEDYDAIYYRYRCSGRHHWLLLHHSAEQQLPGRCCRSYC